MGDSIKDSMKRVLGTESDPVFRTVFRGGSIVLVARILNAVLLLVINVIVARLYHSEMVGVLALINSTLAIASIFSNFGTINSILRLVPEYIQKSGKNTSRIVLNKFTFLVGSVSPVISIIIIIGLYLWRFIFPGNDVNFTLILITAIFLPFITLSKLYTEAIRALQHTKLYAFAHILPALTNLVILGIFITLFQRPDAPVWAFFVSGMIVFMITWIIVNKYAPSNKEIHSTDLPSFKDIVTISIPMGITSGLLLLISNFDILFLGITRTEAETGVYSIASRLSFLTGFIISSINSVSAPQFSHLHFSGQKDALIQLASKSSRLIFWASLPIVLILIVGGKFILGVFGTEFISGYSVLVILVFKEFINAAGGSTGNFLNMTGSHTTFRNIMITAALINIVLNLILIPWLGLVGAAISSITTYLFWNGISSWSIYRQTGKCISYVPTFIRRRFNI